MTLDGPITVVSVSTAQAAQARIDPEHATRLDQAVRECLELQTDTFFARPGAFSELCIADLPNGVLLEMGNPVAAFEFSDYMQELTWEKACTTETPYRGLCIGIATRDGLVCARRAAERNGLRAREGETVVDTPTHAALLANRTRGFHQRGCRFKRAYGTPEVIRYIYRIARVAKLGLMAALRAWLGGGSPRF